MCRVIREARPAWIIGENVAGIVNLALDTVCADLEAEGYEVEPIIIPACAVDAPHRRDRVWIIARNVGDTKLDGYAAAQGFGKLLDQPEKQRGQVEERKFAGAGGSSADVADADCGQLCQCEPEGQSVQVSGQGGERVGDVANSQRTGLEGHGRVEGNDKEGWKEQDRHIGESGDGGWQPHQWLSEPNVGRVAHGVPNRVAKLRGLGNAIVPQVAAEIIRCINKVMEDKNEREAGNDKGNNDSLARRRA
jgi:DNA (cytosine-5)-methyltransferase 1